MSAGASSKQMSNHRSRQLGRIRLLANQAGHTAELKKGVLTVNTKDGWRHRFGVDFSHASNGETFARTHVHTKAPGEPDENESYHDNWMPSGASSKHFWEGVRSRHQFDDSSLRDAHQHPKTDPED